MEQRKEHSLIFWLALLGALLAGVIGIFAALEAVAPGGQGSNAVTWNPLFAKSGAPSPYSVRTVSDRDRESEDVGRWLTASGDHIAQSLEGEAEGHVFWLYRQDRDEYLLYLPEQDRTLTPADITATEEKDEDGQTRLVLRIRTPEEGEEVEPGEQLLSFGTTSEKWNGIRLSVILDGREQEIRVLTSADGELYSTEERYIGRN